MRLLIDTNRYRDLCDAKPDAMDMIQNADGIHIPFIVLAELRSGFLCGTMARKNEQYLTLFLNSPRVTPLFADENTTHHFAKLFAQLRLQGTPIPTNDIWIAALAVQHDLILYSRDQHFVNLPQVAII
ncbi:type II toxin-antitoxin system VapC family toxin [Pontiella sulfatireligans]|uniref:Toxin VapC4 n=1 Tax=Pontiella sulfatireligans TaxID=2750658 RepID=A0A6C2UIS7_9BACT|nr:type II toxin-antitoxin system VapC family toxin [Pontiella sulfatireligans]VGO20122.1 Toxin VapC4 [Pontiella sulfatireligans]